MIKFHNKSIFKTDNFLTFYQLDHFYVGEFVGSLFIESQTIQKTPNIDKKFGQANNNIF